MIEPLYRSRMRDVCRVVARYYYRVNYLFGFHYSRLLVHNQAARLIRKMEPPQICWYREINEQNNRVC